jgi:hypothetical protein
LNKKALAERRCHAALPLVFEGMNRFADCAVELGGSAAFGQRAVRLLHRLWNLDSRLAAVTQKASRPLTTDTPRREKKIERGIRQLACEKP